MTTESVSQNRSAAGVRRPSGAEEGEAACRGWRGGGSASPTIKEAQCLSNSCSGTEFEFCTFLEAANPPSVERGRRLRGYFRAPCPVPGVCKKSPLRRPSPAKGPTENGETRTKKGPPYFFRGGCEGRSSTRLA